MRIAKSLFNSVNSTSLSSFNSNHALYDKIRPDFNTSFVTKFFKTLGLAKQSKILELAAGTGKFTRRLLAQGFGENAVVVEPSEGMLTSFRSHFPELNSQLGSSYDIPLGENSVDSILIAQGFHWFSDHKSLDEMHRVLKPGGKLGLIWNFDTLKNNNNEPRLALTQEDKEAMTTWQDVALEAYKYDSEVPQYRTGRWRNVFKVQKLFDLAGADSQFM